MNRTIPLILAVALFMENMDSTVISTSLPAIAADLGTSPIALKLALTAYFVSLAIFIPVSAWVADRFGAKQVFQAAIGVFICGSLACAMANSIGEFVVFRFLQGMGGAMMTPIARLVLVRATEKKDLVQAIAWLTVPGLMGPLVGPPVGGFITTFASWHWIFLINLPIGLIGIWASRRFLPEIPRGERKRLDLVGFLFVSIAAAGIVFGLSVVSLPALPPVVGIATLAVGVIFLTLYIRHYRRVENPVLDFSLFRNPIFRQSILGASIFRVGVGATPFLMPLLFQLNFGLTPFGSGMLTFAIAIGAIAMKFLATRMLRAGGFRRVMIASAVLGGGATYVVMGFTPETPYWVIITVMILTGFMRSLFFTSSNALVFAEINDRQASQATAIAAASNQICVAVGVAVAGGVLEAFLILTGQSLTREAFIIAFAVVGTISVSGALPFLWMDKRAGSTLSGHRIHGEGDREPPST